MEVGLGRHTDSSVYVTFTVALQTDVNDAITVGLRIGTVLRNHSDSGSVTELSVPDPSHTKCRYQISFNTY